MMNKIMDKKDRFLLLITTVVCLLPLVLSLVWYERLPEQIPIHFNAAGEVDDYASKAVGAFLLPLSMVVVNAVTHLVMNADPKKRNVSGIMMAVAKWTAPVLGGILHPVLLFVAMGYDVPVTVITMTGVGILFILLGNYMPKTKQNYTVGIKIPWTLHSEDNWNKTHRMAGFLWMIGGIIMIVSSFVMTSVPVVLGVIVMLALAPTVYSFMLYKKGI